MEAEITSSLMDSTDPDLCQGDFPYIRLTDHHVRTDWREAREMAAQIPPAFHRTIALAQVAQFAPEDEVHESLEVAWNSAWSCQNPFNTVRTAAWVLEAGIKQARQPGLPRLHQLLEHSRTISNRLGRAVVMVDLWEALAGSPRELVETAAIEESFACQQHWRGLYLVQTLILEIHKERPHFAQSLLERMPESRIRRQTRRLLCLSDIPT